MKTTSSPLFITGLILIFSIAIGILFAPLLSVIILTVVFGTLFDPVNQFLRKRIGSGGAIFLTMLLVILVIIGLAVFVSVEATSQITHLLSGLQSGTIVPNNVVLLVQEKIDVLLPMAHINVMASIESGIGWLIAQIGSISASLLTFVFTLFLTMMALYYWFKDSKKLRLEFFKLIPLSTSDAEEIFASLSLSVHSLVRGTMLVILIQGLLAGIGFVIFGVPNAILWAGMTIVCALVPTLGTSLVIAPVVLYVFLTGHPLSALGLAAWGLTMVGLVDNFLGPRLMSRGSNLHPLFTLFAIVGGLKLFGPVGALAGPLIVSLFFVISKIYVASRATTASDTKNTEVY